MYQDYTSTSQQPQAIENDFSLTFTPATGTTGTPARGGYRIVQGVGTDSRGDKFLAGGQGRAKLTPTKRSEPCPVCDDHKGKCRVGSNLVLCMTHQNPVPGWEYQGLTKNGLWGKFREPQDHWQRPRLEPVRVEKPKDRERTAEQWHKHYTAIQQQLPTLASKDRADLENRLKVAGLEPDLTKLGAVSLSSGYIIPIPNHDGLLTGAQIRLRGDVEGGRYRWDKCPKGIDRHIDGELPLAVWSAPGHASQPVDRLIVEGTGVKPYIASQILGITAIGAAGGLHSSSPQLLTLALGTAKTVAIIPDGGAVQNENVLHQYRATQDLLQGQGLTVLYGWWGQTTKDQGDIDEGIDPSTIQWLKPDQFWAMVAPELMPTPKGIAEKFDKAAWIQRVSHWQDWADRIDLTPTHTYPDYFPRLPLDCPQGGLIVIAGCMGTGKTSSALMGLVESHRAQFPDAARYLTFPRNLLGHQSGKILGIPHHETVQDPRNAKDLGFCIPSIHKVRIEAIPPNSLWVWDEIEQTIHEMLQGDCLKSLVYTPGQILAMVQAMAHAIIDRGGWIVASEDGISNLGIDFIHALTGRADLPHQFHKSLKTPAWGNVTLVDSPAVLLGLIVEAINAGENVILPFDSKTKLEEIQREVMTRCGLTESECPTITADSDGKTTRDFANNPDQWIQDNKPRFLGFTPSIQSGVSITIPHFHKQFTCITHLDPRVAKQLPARYRVPVPMVAYVKEYGIPGDSEGTSYTPQGWLHQYRQNRKDQAQLLDLAQAVAGDQTLGTALDRLLDPNDSEYGFWLRLRAQFDARAAWGKANLREQMQKIWQDQGRKVTLLEGTNKDLTKSLKQTREDLGQERAELAAKLPTHGWTVSKALKVLGTERATLEDRLTARKVLLQDALPPLAHLTHTPDFLLATMVGPGQRAMAGMRLHWASQNLTQAIAQERDAWLKRLTRATEQQSIVWGYTGPGTAQKADLLEGCPVWDAIATGAHLTGYDDSTDWAIATHQWALERADLFKTRFRLTILDSHTPIDTVGKILRKLGFVVKRHRKRIEGVVTSYYKATDLAGEYRDQVLEAMTSKASEAIHNSYSGESTQIVDQPPAPPQYPIIDTPHGQAWQWFDPNGREWICFLGESQWAPRHFNLSELAA